MNGTVIRKLWLIWLIVRCSSEPNDKKKKNSHVSTKKMTGNITNNSTELELFLHIWLCKPKYFILSELYFGRLFCFSPLITKFKHWLAFETKQCGNQVRREQFNCNIKLFCCRVKETACSGYLVFNI